MCYQLLLASDRRMPVRRVSERVNLVGIEATPEIAEQFESGAHFAEVTIGGCACDLVAGGTRRGPRAEQRERQRHEDFLAIAEWLEEQIVGRRRPVWLYLCWLSELDLPELGRVRWTLDDFRQLGADVPSRTIIELVGTNA